MTAASLSLGFDVYELSFESLQPARFLPFAGSAWRGALGRALRRLVCVEGLRPCVGCSLETACLFTRLFDPRHGGEVPLLGRVNRKPPPFVLDIETPTPCSLNPGDAFGLRLVVIGSARPFAPYLLRALVEGARHGVGPDRARFTLASLQPIKSSLPEADPAPPAVEVELLTPLRLKADNRLVSPNRLTPQLFVQALLRRLSLLAACYGEPPAPLPMDFWQQRLLRVRGAEADMQWVEQLRHSFYQQTRMRMGGLLGRLRLELEGPDDPLWPLLRYGEFLHVGKGVTMGLGRYRLTSIGNAARRRRPRMVRPTRLPEGADRGPHAGLGIQNRS